MEKTPSPVPVTISTGTLFRFILIGLLFGLLFILRDVILIILTSVVIASSVEPITKRLGRYRISRVPAVLLTYVVCFAFLIGLLYAFLPPLIEDLSGVASSLPEQLGSSPNLLPSAGRLGILTSSLTRNLSLADLAAQGRTLLANFADNLFHTASTIFGGGVSFILILVFSFYLAVQEKGIENFLRIIAPAEKEKYIISLWQRTQAKIGLWMQGQLLLGLIVGILAFLGLTLLQIKYALLLAILAAVLELIPLFGPIISMVPAALLGFTQSASLGLMVIGFYIIVQQFENHLIYPLVVKKIVGVPALVVIIGLLVGAKLAGFLGLILAVPVATLLMEWFNDLERQKLADQGA